VGGWVQRWEEADDLGAKDRRGEDSGIEGIFEDKSVGDAVGRHVESWMEAF
jgi:hypothetical protein